MDINITNFHDSCEMNKSTITPSEFENELDFQKIGYGTVGGIINYILEHFAEIAYLMFEITKKTFKRGLEIMSNVKIDNEVKNLLNLDICLGTVISNILTEIKISSSAFAMEIESIEISKRKTTDYLEHEDIITRVKVPKDKRMKEIDAFWNHIGRTLSQTIDELEFISPEKAAKLNQSLLVIVSNR